MKGTPAGGGTSIITSTSSTSTSKRRRLPHHHTPSNSSSSEGPSLYQGALAALQGLQARFSVPVDARLPHAMALLLHEQAALRGELRAAHELGLLLRGLSRPPALTPGAARRHEVGVGVGGGGGLEAYVEGVLQWCGGLAATGRAGECVRAAERLAAFCERKSE